MTYQACDIFQKTIVHYFYFGKVDYISLGSLLQILGDTVQHFAGGIDIFHRFHPNHHSLILFIILDVINTELPVYHLLIVNFLQVNDRGNFVHECSRDFQFTVTVDKEVKLIVTLPEKSSTSVDGIQCIMLKLGIFQHYKIRIPASNILNQIFKIVRMIGRVLFA